MTPQTLQVSVQHTPSHIIPVHVGDPILSSTLSDNLLRNHGHYVQVGRVDHMLGDGDNILGDGESPLGIILFPNRQSTTPLWPAEKRS